MTPGGDAGPAASRPEALGRSAAPADERAGSPDRLGDQPSPRPRFTSRAAVLVVVLCAIGLSLAYPIREYIAERRQIDQLEAENGQLAVSVQRLKSEQHAISSPSYIEQIARDQLHMCFPTQTCYVIVQPETRSHDKAGRTTQSAAPWYGALWASVRAADRQPPR